MIGKDSHFGKLIIAVAVLSMTAGGAEAKRPRYRAVEYVPHPGFRIAWALPQEINSQNVAAGHSEGPMEIVPTQWFPDGSMIGGQWHVYPAGKVWAINENNYMGGMSYYEWDAWEAAIWAPDGTINVIGGLWEQYMGLARVEGLNDDMVAVGVSTNDTVPARAFRWTEETGMVDIGTLGGAVAWAKAINNQGQIVGFSNDENDTKHGFLWEDDKFTKMGLLPGGQLSEAIDINDAGIAVGGADYQSDPTNPGLPFHAVMWDTTPDKRSKEDTIDAIHLGVPFEGGQAYAVAINNHGQVVGNGENPEVPGDYYFPWIWEDGEMKLLQDMLPPDTDWILYHVTDINDKGWITGYDAQGHNQGFVLIPLLDGDLDYDGDVDLDDHASFVSCMTGPVTSDIPVACISADINGDRDVDLDDFHLMSLSFGMQQ